MTVGLRFVPRFGRAGSRVRMRSSVLRTSSSDGVVLPRGPAGAGADQPQSLSVTGTRAHTLPADFVCRKSVGRCPFRLCRSPGPAHLLEGLRCDGASSRTEGKRSGESSPFMSAITCRVRMCQLQNVAMSGSSGTAARRRGEPRHRAMRRGAARQVNHRCRDAGIGRPGSFTARTVLRAGTSDSRMDAAWSRLSSG